MKNKLTFKIKENGVEKEYFVIKMISNKTNNKNYIIYSENNDEKDIYASSFEVSDDEIKLNEIETEDEWNYIDNILSNIGDK